MSTKVKAKLRSMDQRGLKVHTRWGYVQFDGNGLAEVEEVDSAEPAALARGDSFASVCIDGLPYTPTIQCGGIVAHVLPGPDPSAGFLLTGLKETDRKNIERILARRFPTTFGQAFPQKRRKTDIADQAGTPVQVKTADKAAEVVAPPPLPAAEAARPSPRGTLC